MKMMRCLLLLLPALLTACGSEGSVRDTLGLNRSAPDEFKVVSRPPLSVPPEFRLVTPTPGAPARGVGSARQRGADVLLSRTDEGLSSLGNFNLNLDLGGLDDYSPQTETSVAPVMSSALESAADSRFLGRAGADAANSDIRRQLAEDQLEAPQESESSFSGFALHDWLGGGEPSEVVVDPMAEAARIRENLDEDKPVNEGEVETITQSPSTLDLIFD